MDFESNHLVFNSYLVVPLRSPNNKQHALLLRILQFLRLLVQRTYLPHVDANGTYDRTVVALTNEGRTPIEFRSLAVRLASHAGGAKDCVLRMLYDPKTKLFYWESYGLYPGYAPEGDANLADQYLRSAVIYLDSSQIVLFSIGFGGSVSVHVSTEREDSLSRGQASTIHGLERKTATPFRISKVVTYWKQLPASFFQQCITDINMPNIQSVERQTKLWQVTVAAQNGNTAMLSLDESYNLISTKITLDPNADTVGGCKR